ncbi:MAG: beta-N-acetylhexosaminidase [Proteobacteria bacterium]|nr:beta-N-acetylhexosaminidase [Pseudomonadota bacterium]
MTSNGVVMLDINGTSLTNDDKRRLSHPNCFGVILFARNFLNKTQLSELCRDIKDLRPTPIAIAVDHEGGRVQRFKDEFTLIPAMRDLGIIWMKDKLRANDLAKKIGLIIALELRSCGVDFSFTPVLDLDYGKSKVIGDRAFHSDPRVVSELSYSIIKGLTRGGSVSVGKHFPGHGFVSEDSHLEIVTDHRSLDLIMERDVIPFANLIDNGVSAIMPAHVVYPSVDSLPVGFSEYWLKNILRVKLGFKGVIFSDDLSMKGAFINSSIEERGKMALNAGCDVILVCNEPDDADRLLDAIPVDRISKASNSCELFLHEIEKNAHEAFRNNGNDRLYTRAVESIEDEFHGIS